MRILLLLGISILRSWSCTKSNPVNEVSGADVDFLHDVMNDGFIVDNPVFPSATTEVDNSNTASSTKQEIELSSTNISITDPGKESTGEVQVEALDFIEDDISLEEGSTVHSSVQHGEQDYLFSINTDLDSTVKPTNLPNQSTTIPITTGSPLSTTTDHHNSSATVIQNEGDLFFEGKESSERTNGEGLQSGPTRTSTRADITNKNLNFLGDLDELGSSSGLSISKERRILPKNEETINKSDTVYYVAMDKPTYKKELNPDVTSTENFKQFHDVNSAPEPHHSTPGWLVIVATTVGIIAMLLVCVAIATRESWNGRDQESGNKKEKVSLNVQKGVEERETMLYKEKPRETLNVGEYSVILLEELPEEKPLH